MNSLTNLDDVKGNFSIDSDGKITLGMNVNGKGYTPFHYLCTLCDWQNRNSEVLGQSCEVTFAPKIGDHDVNKKVKRSLILDDYSHFSWVIPLNAKSNVFEQFKYFVSMVENLLPSFIKCIQTNNGGEFIGGKFLLFLQSKGISRHISYPYML